MGLFFAPNQAAVMNSLPPDQRGAGAGMLNTFQNSATVLSMGLFFTIVTLGLASRLPSHLYRGLVARGRRPRRRAPGRQRAADRQPVLGLPRLQPDQGTARPDRSAAAAACPPGRVHHRPVVLPEPDRGAVRRRPAPGLHLRRRRDGHRDRGLRAARQALLPRRPSRSLDELAEGAAESAAAAGPRRVGRRGRPGRRRARPRPAPNGRLATSGSPGGEELDASRGGG